MKYLILIQGEMIHRKALRYNDEVADEDAD